MGVRPPQGGSNTRRSVEFGIAALDGHLDDINFPVTESELVATLDDPRIPYDGAGNKIPLSEALDATSTSRFESKSDLLDRLHPVFEERRASASGGIVTRLRSLLPF
ncbi:MAG: hypothetical protein ACQETI_08235 [Halobacteriota archaeon]